jgi:hypothetical protein
MPFIVARAGRLVFPVADRQRFAGTGPDTSVNPSGKLTEIYFIGKDELTVIFESHQSIGSWMIAKTCWYQQQSEAVSLIVPATS